MNRIVITFFILILSIVNFSFLSLTKTSAQSCPTTCDGDEEVIPDIACVNAKLLDPRTQCCENKCPGDRSSVDDDDVEQLQKLVNLFGNTYFVASPKRFGAIINMSLIAVMTALTAFAFVYGILVAGFQRSKATEEAEIEKANKTLIQLIVGFSLAWSLIFIVNFVTTFLGLGGLGSLTVVDSGEDPAEIIIKPDN